MNTEREIDRVLVDDSLDDDSREEGKCELIEALIPEHGWEDVQQAMIAVLEDENRRQADYMTAAQLFWGAALDRRSLQVSKVIALLYHRLQPDPGSDESNLAWSIVCKLKGVDYLSEYNPLDDPEVEAEMRRIRKIQ